MNESCDYEIKRGSGTFTCAVFGWAHDKHPLVKEFPHPFTPKGAVVTDGDILVARLRATTRWDELTSADLDKAADVIERLQKLVCERFGCASPTLAYNHDYRCPRSEHYRG